MEDTHHLKLIKIIFIQDALVLYLLYCYVCLTTVDHFKV